MKEITIFVLLVTVVCCRVIQSGTNTFTVDLGNNADNADWWEKSVIYQIYPRSFKDSNNDGIGDLQGIIEKLDYFVDLGVDAIWLSPIYQSPMVDAGYDISDYRAIAVEYGTLEDFKELLAKAHELSLKVILDFVPNHTSDLHEWFSKSVAKEAGYEDYYVWNDGIVDEDGNRNPPNNWLSIWTNSGWEWNDERQQYYFHQFSKQQPDLNYRNEKVHQEMKDVMTYWLDLGVDGFRVDAVPHIYEDAQLRDEPIVPDSGVDPNNWNYLDHIYTKDQPETFELVYSWRDHLDNYTATVGGDTRIFMTECSTDIENVERYYGNGTRLGAHFSFNFFFLGLNEESTGVDILDAVWTWYSTVGVYYTLNWLTGNHDNARIASKVGTRNIDAYNMLITFLAGVTVTYMAEEIGQENGEVTCEEGQDPSAIGNCSTFAEVSRDFERTPFQWDTTVNAGFNEGAKPWLPVGSKYLETNLASQKEEENSHYNIYKKLIKMKTLFDGYNTFSLNGGDAMFHATRFSAATSDCYQLLYNVNLENWNTGLSNFTIIAKSVDLEYQPGEYLVLKPGDSAIIQYEWPSGPD